jgi:hypothetical protein
MFAHVGSGRELRSCLLWWQRRHVFKPLIHIHIRQQSCARYEDVNFPANAGVKMTADVSYAPLVAEVADVAWSEAHETGGLVHGIAIRWDTRAGLVLVFRVIHEDQA